MHRYTQQELENIFKDKTLSKEIIPFIKNNKIRQDIWLEKYQSKWKLIQNQLSHGLLCPICGTILFKFYDRHLQKHGLSLQAWYDTLHDIEIHPSCPICGKHTKFLNDKLMYRKFCCNSHARMYIDIQTGLLNGWTIDEITAHNKVVKDSTTKCGYSTTSKYGSEFKIELTYEQRKNRNLLNDNDYILWQQTQYNLKSNAGKLGAKTVAKRYGCHLKSFGFRSTIILSDTKVFSLDSQQELFHLLKRIYINRDNINNIENKIFLENTTAEFNGKSAYSDLVIIHNGIKTNYEVHSTKDIDTINRKRYCSKINGYNFVLENIDFYTYPNGKYVQQLKEFIDIDKIYLDLTTAHYQHKQYTLNLQYDII